MGDINILDCTLRDGGYCNEWLFGNQNIKKIISGLVAANVDIIECGFLTNKAIYQPDVSKFTTLDEVATVIPENRVGKIFVCMMNYGEYRMEDLPPYDGTSLDGIRVAFHKKDLVGALEVCRQIKAKGYKVFIQAMVSLNYSDEEFLNLIQICNGFEPYAFYIVDSFGVMRRKDLMRLFYMVEHNLKESIYIGFHSHNNLQLAYSNAQTLVDIRTKHDLVIDSSVFGMGRGAGNLNTELFVEYLNEHIQARYDVKPLLTIIDEILNDFYQRDYWGYSLPNYLSASHNAHPNYASYLDAKKTLTIENMNEIFAMMDEMKKTEFDKKYIEELYVRYMAKDVVQEKNLTDFKTRIAGKRILIVAPGQSSNEEQVTIKDFSEQDDVVTIAVNFNYRGSKTDFIFLSNLRRFREISPECYDKMIITANIPVIDTYLQVKYVDLLNHIEAVRDNATMMLIQYLIRMGVGEIYLAGLDGYSIDANKNFADDRMSFVAQKTVFEAMNQGMHDMLQEYSKHAHIQFLTSPRFVTL